MKDYIKNLNEEKLKNYFYLSTIAVFLFCSFLGFMALASIKDSPKCFNKLSVAIELASGSSAWFFVIFSLLIVTIVAIAIFGELLEEVFIRKGGNQ